MKKGKRVLQVSSGERNSNRIRERAEFSKLIERVDLDDLEELREIVFKVFGEDYKEGEAVLDWVLRAAPNFKMMQIRMIMVIRAYFLFGRGDFREGISSSEFLSERKDKAN